MRGRQLTPSHTKIAPFACVSVQIFADEEQLAPVQARAASSWLGIGINAGIILALA
jgi:hypothetical protein